MPGDIDGPMASPAQSCSGPKQVTLVANAAEISETVSMPIAEAGTGIVNQYGVI